MQAAQSISPAVWAVTILPGIHFQLENLTEANQIYAFCYYYYYFNKHLHPESYHLERKK